MHTGLYSGSDGTLLTTFEVANPEGKLNAFEASCLSIVPDLDGDGASDLLISGFDAGTDSQPLETASHYAGFVAAFRLTTGDPLWTSASPCTDAFGTGFGEALALLGDLNGDGACEVATAGYCEWQPATLWVLCGGTGDVLDEVSVQHPISHPLQALGGAPSATEVDLIAGPKHFTWESGFVGRLRLVRCAANVAEQEATWTWTVTGRDLVPD